MAIRGCDSALWNFETVVRGAALSRRPRARRDLPPPSFAPSREAEPDEAETLLIQRAYRPAPSSARTPAAPAATEEREPVSTPDPIPPSLRPVIWLLTAVFLVVIGCRAVPAAVDRVASVNAVLEGR